MDLSRLHSVGNLDLLVLPKVAFFCSRSAPSQARGESLAWAARAREERTCVISGFHSEVEKEVLRHLLAGSQPLIVALARGLKEAPEPEWAVPLERERLLVITRYARSVTHPSEESCHQRNRLMMELAEQAVVGYASPGGKLEKLCTEFAARRPILLLSPLAPLP